MVKDGQLIYKRGYGMASLDYDMPNSPETLFDVSSMDKQFTAMSVLLLARQGKLSMDDEIQKYLPEIPRYQSPVTIRQLVHHTSGIRDSVQLAALAIGMWDGLGTELLSSAARQTPRNGNSKRTN